MTEHVLVSEWSTRLALAVELEDEFAPHLPPQGELTVSLTGARYRRSQFQPGRSEYYLFLEAPDGPYQLETKARYYLDEALAVNLPRPDPSSPVVKMVLQPNPLYLFPEGTTLIKGTVLAPDSQPLPNTAITILNRTEKTKTTAQGAFVIFFKSIASGPVQLQASHASYGNITVTVTVTQGKVVVQTIQYP